MKNLLCTFLVGGILFCSWLAYPQISRQMGEVMGQSPIGTTLRVNAQVMSYIGLTISGVGGANLETRGRDVMLRFGSVDAFGLSRSNQSVSIHTLSDRSGAVYMVPLKITAGISGVDRQRGELTIQRTGARGPDSVPQRALVMGNFGNTYRTSRDFEILHSRAPIVISKNLGAGIHTFNKDVGLYVRPQDTAGRRTGRVTFTLMVQ